MKLKINRLLSLSLNYSRKHPAIIWIFSILWLFLIGWIAFLWNLGNVGLVDETEPLFAEAARQMTVTGDWITPYFNGETRFDKPPLIYWLMAIAYNAIGVNEWAVRLPSALSAIALMCFLFFTLLYFSFPNSRTLWKHKTEHSEATLTPSLPSGLCAALGAAIMALNVQTIAWGRTGVSDMLLSACMGSALLAFFWGYALKEVKSHESEERGQKSTVFWLENADFWYLVFYAFMGLAVLTKGPVGIVLPGLIIGAFLLYVGKLWEVIGETRPVRGSAIFLAIAVPWYILVIFANGETYIDTFFGYHNFERFTSVVNRHGEPWYFYFLVILGGFAPWSVYLPVALARLRFWKRDRWRTLPRSQHLGLFAFFWFSVIFLFFTVAVTKLPSYVLPSLPAAAILVAIFWIQETVKPEKKSIINRKNNLLFRILLITNLLILVIIAGGIIYVSHTLERDPAMPNFPELLQDSGLVERGAAIAISTAIVGAVLLLRRQWRYLIVVNLVSFVAFFIFALTPVYFLVDTERQLPVRQIADIIAQVKKPEEEVIMIAFEKPSLVFYSKLPITFFRRSTDSFEYLQQLAVNQPQPPEVLIVGYPNKIKGIGIRESSEFQLLAEQGNYRLIRVEKEQFLLESNLEKHKE